MTLIPEWAPNIHPMIVHFPIVLLVLAVMADAASLIFKKHQWLNNATISLFVIGTVSAIITYFTGKSAADNVFLPPLANPIVNEHSDLALWTVLFFGALTVIKISIMYKLPKANTALKAGIIVAGFTGLGLLGTTAEHGAQLVYQYGVGVNVVVDERKEIVSTPVETDSDKGIVNLEDGSWYWVPTNGAPNVLKDQFDWLENSSEHLAPNVVTDNENATVLELNPHGMRVMFVAGDKIIGTQADLIVNVANFKGSFMLVFHVQDKSTFDFVELANGTMNLGRYENDVRNVWNSKPYTSDIEWLNISAVGEGGHYRGLYKGDTLTHGHDDELPSGKFGFRIDGNGKILIKSMNILVLN